MDYKDYYKTLGVPKNAPAKDIKAAYRRLAREHHPDMNAGDAKAEARFKEINEAHDVLSDPEKRRRYDQLGSDWSRYANAGPQGWPGSGGGGVHFNVGGRNVEGFSDFFQTFFSGLGGAGKVGFEEVFGGRGRARGGGRGRGRVRGPDLETPVELSLEEVRTGTTRELTVGHTGKPRKVEVKIPPGVRDGSKVRVAGEGGPGQGGASGDLFLKVRVRPDPRFERRGDDLHAEVTAPLSTLVLGGEVDVPTLEDTRGIKVPPGTPTGRVFRLRALGLPVLGSSGQRGDLLATLRVELPSELSEDQRRLFEELREKGL